MNLAVDPPNRRFVKHLLYDGMKRPRGVRARLDGLRRKVLRAKDQDWFKHPRNLLLSDLYATSHRLANKRVGDEFRHHPERAFD